MKLNLDCIRDILLYLEEHLQLSPNLDFEVISIFDMKNDMDYSIQEIANTVIVLGEAGFISVSADYSDIGIEEVLISHITYDGYQFIETIRPETVFEKVKSICLKIGSMSIDMVTKTASSVTASMLTSCFLNL